MEITRAQLFNMAATIMVVSWQTQLTHIYQTTSTDSKWHL